MWQFMSEKVSAIICEFNPLHLGHKYIMDYARSENHGPLICLMSGNFVQRGEPACFSKWARTKAALVSGADLVIELPTIYAASSAEYFATGAVNILDSLGIVDKLVFGVESEKYAEIEKYVQLRTENEESFFSDIKSRIKDGSSFCSQISPDGFIGSNNILAGEYLCALARIKSKIEPMPVARTGNETHNTTAGNLRRLIKNGENFTGFIPSETVSVINNEYNAGKGPVSSLNCENFILARLRQMTAEDVSKLPFVSEGLEYKIIKEAVSNGSYNALRDACVSKRYTRGRISRILMSVVTGVTADLLKEFRNTPPYIKILGFNNTGRQLLSQISEKCTVPMFAQPSQGLFILTGNSKLVLEKEINATSVYMLGCPKVNARWGDAELTEKVVKFEVDTN